MMVVHKIILFGDSYQLAVRDACHHAQDVLEEGDVNIGVDLRCGDEIWEGVDAQELEVTRLC